MAAPTPQRRVAIFLALSLLLHAGAVWFAHSWRGQQRSLYVIYRPSQPDQQPFKRDSRAVVPADPRPLSAPTFNTPPREFAGWSDMLGRKGQTSGSPVGGLDTTGLALDVDRPEGRLEREALQAWKDSVYAALILEREANPLGPLDPFEIEMTALVQRRSTVVLDSTGRLLRGYWYFPVYEVYSTAPDPSAGMYFAHNAYAEEMQALTASAGVVSTALVTAPISKSAPCPCNRSRSSALNTLITPLLAVCDNSRPHSSWDLCTSAGR